MRQIFILSLLVTSGCVTFDPKDYANMHVRTGIVQNFKRNYKPVKSKLFGVETKELSITYVPDLVDAGTSFQFKNKTNNAIKIIWDETTFIDRLGHPKKIFHSGVKIVDRNGPQLPTVIPPNTQISDDLISTDKVHYLRYSDTPSLNRWAYNPLCGTIEQQENYTMKIVDDSHCIGKTFGYFITYEIKGKKKHTTAKFVYVSKKPWENTDKKRKVAEESTKK